MKCPVCSTKLLPNESVCPNCGMTVRKDNITQTTKDNTYKTNQSYQFKEKPKYLRSDLSTGQKASRIIRLILIAGILGFIIFIGVGKVIDNIFYTDITGISYHEAINNDYDDTVKNMILYRDNLLDFLDNNNYSFYVEEETYKEDSFEDIIKATSKIVGDSNTDNEMYNIEIEFQNGELYNITFVINGNASINLQETELIDQDIFNSITDELGFENAYQELEKGLSSMEKEYSGKMIYEYKGKYSIHLERTFENVVNGPSISYDFEYRISLK